MTDQTTRAEEGATRREALKAAFDWLQVYGLEGSNPKDGEHQKLDTLAREFEGFGRHVASAAESRAASAEAEVERLKRTVAFQEAELLRLHQDNERLRWRHPTVLPEWNDLPDDMRARLAKAADSFDPEWGVGLAITMLEALRNGMDNAARAALKESTHV